MNIVGGGNHCADILAIAQRCGLHATVYDDNPNLGHLPPAVLHGPLVVGVNDPVIRRCIVNRYRLALAAAPLVDPSALIGEHVHCGHGSVVGPMASLLHSVTLGNHVHVNSHVNIVRSTVGDYTTVSPGATICGNVTIGEACAIGANATICERVTIGDEVIIAAGGIVPPYSIIPDGTTVIGVWHGPH